MGCGSWLMLDGAIHMDGPILIRVSSILLVSRPAGHNVDADGPEPTEVTVDGYGPVYVKNSVEQVCDFLRGIVEDT